MDRALGDRKNDANAGMTKFEAWAYRGSRKKKAFQKNKANLNKFFLKVKG